MSDKLKTKRRHTLLDDNTYDTVVNYCESQTGKKQLSEGIRLMAKEYKELGFKDKKFNRAEYGLPIQEEF